VLVSDRKFAGADVLATSYTLSQAVKSLGEFDVIICGKQTTDGDTAQVGPEMAEYLNIPHVANVTKIVRYEEDRVVVEMDMPTTVEVAAVEYPCLMTVEKDIFSPRLPSYKRKMETYDREIKVLSVKDFFDQDEMHYGLNGSPTQVERIFPPESTGEKEFYRGDSKVVSRQVSDKLVELKLV